MFVSDPVTQRVFTDTFYFFSLQLLQNSNKNKEKFSFISLDPAKGCIPNFRFCPYLLPEKPGCSKGGTRVSFWSAIIVSNFERSFVSKKLIQRLV